MTDTGFPDYLVLEAVERFFILYLRDSLHAYSKSDGLRIKRIYAFASRTRTLLTIIGNEEFTWNLMKNNEVLFRSFEKLVLSRSWFEFDWMVVDTRVNTSVRAKFENAWSGTYHAVQPCIHVPLSLAPHCQCTSFPVDQDEYSQIAVSVSSSNAAHPTNREISNIKYSFQTTRTSMMKIIEDKQTVQVQRTCDEIFPSLSSSSLGPSDIADKRVFSYTDIITIHDQKNKEENKKNEYTIPSFSILGKNAIPCTGRQLAIILLLFFNVCVSNTNASSDVKRVIGTFRTFSTGSCGRESYFKKSCPPRSNFDMLMKLCDYQCQPGYQPQCITVKGGSVYTCLSSNLTCPPGVRWLPFLTNNNLTHVTIMQEECPAGYFQSTNSNCFDACKDKHKDTSILPEELLIYSMGDAKSPTMVYCNFKENYFNVNGDFLIDLNSFMEHDRYFCSNIEYVKSPCPENLQILPNGKCVTPCEEGSEIDVYANFTCTSSIVLIKVTSSIVRTPQTSAITSSPTTSSTTNGKDEVQTGEDDTSTGKDTFVIVTVVIVASLVFALLAFAIFIYCYCKKKKDSKRGGPATDVEGRQLEACPERETASRESSIGTGSLRASVVEAPSYIVHNETHAEHVFHVGKHASVQIHHHYAASSSSANQSADQENQYTEDDNTDGRIKGQNVKPIVRFSNDANEDDILDSKSTDGTETTALLISEGGKTKVKKLTASPYGSQDDEDPANGAIDSNVTEPLLASFETNDSGNNDEENTELKTVGQEVAQNVKPIVRFSNDADEDDVLDSKSTDGTETKALLISKGGKTKVKKLTASPYGSQDDEDPANGAIDSNITDPLLASFETNDSGNNDEENTEIKSILTDNTHLGILITLTDQTEDNSADITQIKTLNTDTTLYSSDGKLINNNNISNILNNEQDINTTERKSLYNENGIRNTKDTPKMSLLKDIESNDESADNERADTSTASTDNVRMSNLKEPHELCNNSINTDNNTKIKELFDPSENSNTNRYGPESESHFRLHLSVNTEDTANSEMLKEYDGDFGHTRIISSSLSDQGLSVSDRSLEGQVSSRRSSGFSDALR